MRPSIGSELEKRIEENYQDAGCSSKAEFIRYATRRTLDEMEK